MATSVAPSRGVFDTSIDGIQLDHQFPRFESKPEASIGGNGAHYTLKANDAESPLDTSQHARPHLLPAGAVDTHVHVFDPDLGPYAPTRSYTPGNAPLNELLAFNGSISASATPTGIVFVQPSPYRTDNSVLLSVLRQCQVQGLPFVRGIAVVDLNKVTDQALQHMHDLGVRGLRLNLQADGHSVDTVALKSTVELAAQKVRNLPGWMLQLFAPAIVWEELYSVIVNLPVVVIADHTAGLQASSKLPPDHKRSPLQQPGLAAVIRLAQQSRVLIKISGLYRSSNDLANNFEDMALIINYIAEQAPDSLLWASDWPHTGEGAQRAKAAGGAIEPFRVIDNKAILANLRKWIGSEETWLKMMVDNPRRAYR